MEQITEELLQTMYTRAMQYCKVRFGSEPDELQVTYGGMFKVVYGNTCMGEYYENEEYFSAECLSENLDAVYSERKRLEEEQRLIQQIQNEKESKLRAEREFENRRSQYLKLKKEFES